MSAKKAPSSSTTVLAPMPKKPPRRGKVPCGVCQGPIVDGKDEALLCEGDCGLWYHRGCASIPPALYKSLSNSADPFICLACTNIYLKQEIVQLKNELACTTDIRDKYSALAAEVTSLRQVVDSLVKDAKSSSKASARPKRSYATAVTASTTVSRPDATTSKPAAIASQQTGPEKSPASSSNASGESSKSRIKVDGARKIWGTVPTCSAGAVAATISKLVPTKLQLRIRRKTRNLNGNKVVWWFVVHGVESDLDILERDWEKVKVQTLWSLENCYMPLTSSTQPESHASPSNESMTQSPPAATHPSERVSSKQPSPAATASSPKQQPSKCNQESDNIDVVVTSVIDAEKAGAITETSVPPTPPFRNTPLCTTPPLT